MDTARTYASLPPARQRRLGYAEELGHLAAAPEHGRFVTVNGGTSFYRAAHVDLPIVTQRSLVDRCVQSDMRSGRGSPSALYDVPTTNEGNEARCEAEIPIRVGMGRQLTRCSSE